MKHNKALEHRVSPGRRATQEDRKGKGKHTGATKCVSNEYPWESGEVRAGDKSQQSSWVQTQEALGPY